jgi:hypothetical protein
VREVRIVDGKVVTLPDRRDQIRARLDRLCPNCGSDVSVCGEVMCADPASPAARELRAP